MADSIEVAGTGGKQGVVVGMGIAPVEMAIEPTDPMGEALSKKAVAVELKAKNAARRERWTAGAANAITSIFVALEMNADAVSRVVVTKEQDQELVRQIVLTAGWPKAFESRIQISSAVDVPLIIASSRPMLLICLSPSPEE